MRKLLIGIILGSLITGIVTFIYLNTNILFKERIIFPQNILDRYKITYAQSTALPQNKGETLIIGFVSKDDAVSPKSYLGIYKSQSSGTLEEIYKYSPIASAEAEYPRPLLLEKIWLYKPLDENNSESLTIVTSWGETGANYFGTHPVAIAYKNGKFKTIAFYEGNLSENPQIKDFIWTQKDFEVENYFNKAEKVKTILTQGVTVEEGNIELRFYGDNNCHACEHNFIELKFPVAEFYP